jgi:NADH dehydrogenase
LSSLDGGRKQPFVFGGLGQLASLGRGSAVAEVLGVQLSGWLAWWLWRCVYLSKLPSFERRVRVMFDWMLGRLLPRCTVRLQLDRTASVRRLHYQPGQAIVRQGDVGSRFFLIVRGEVEVVREAPGGGETQLATLGPGDYFGELVLLRGGRRNATVRAASPVDLLGMERGDFLALATHGPYFGERLEKAVRERAPASPSAPAPVQDSAQSPQASHSDH